MFLSESTKVRLGKTSFCNKEVRPSNSNVNYVKTQSEVDIRDVYNNWIEQFLQ